MHFGVLGPLMVTDEGTTIPLPSAKMRSLLVALLMDANSTVSVSALEQILWGDDPPASSRASLLNLVMRIRRLLGPTAGARIRTSPPGYLIEVRDGELDEQVFVDGCERGRRARRAGDWATASAELTGALALWRGDPGADLFDSPAAAARIHRLAETRLLALEGRIEAELNLGRHQEAIAELRTLTAEFPLVEAFHGQLMLALYRSRRQGEALEAYRAVRAQLAEDLGIGPSSELRNLHQRILTLDADLDLGSDPVASTGSGSSDAARPAPAPPPANRNPRLPVPAQLPSDLTEFTGRSAELKNLLNAFGAEVAPDAAGTATVCLIAGTGGVGKTTLAVHTAHLLASRFPDGQLFLNLRGASERCVEPAQALSAFLRALGISAEAIPQDQQERETFFRSLLATRRMLIVLDDARDAAQIRSLFPGTATCGVLITSRNRCASLSVSARVELGSMDQEEADALFTAVVGKERVFGEPEARARILDACGRHPLAVRIAAARLVARPAWTLEFLADRLAAHRGRLGELVVDDLEVRISFALSHDALLNSASAADQESARLFRLLGLWPGGEIGLPGLAALVDREPAAAQAAVDRLIDIHLVQELRPGRFSLHDLLRLFAGEVVADPEQDADSRSAIERLGGWYGHSIYAAMECMRPEEKQLSIDELTAPAVRMEFDSYDVALAWMDLEQLNILAVIRQAGALRIEPVARLLPLLVVHNQLMRRRYEELVETQLIGLASARRTQQLQHEPVALNCLAHAYMDLKQTDKALATAHESLEIQTRRGNLRGQGTVLETIGLAYYFAERYDEALEWFERSLEIRDRAGNTYEVALTLNNLGELYSRLGRFADAVQAHHKQLPLAQAVGSRILEACGLVNLGESYAALGRLTEAEAASREGIVIARELDDPEKVAVGLVHLGECLVLQGDRSGGAAAWAEAADLFDQLDEPAGADLRRRIAALEHQDSRALDLSG
jgi:DNA-binding SARP family transcriptional activator